MEAGQATPEIDGSTSPLELLGLAQSLCAATSLSDLARRFSAVFPPVFRVPMFGLYVVEPWTGELQIVTSANVSDAFLRRYEERGREVDSLYEHVLASRRPAYNLALMSREEWLEHPLFLDVKRLHGLRHEIQAPVLTRNEFVGTINFGTSDPSRGFTPGEVQLAEGIGRVVGTALERIHYTDDVEREQHRIEAARELAGMAIVISDPLALEPRLNVAARRMLGRVVDAETQLHALIARPAEGGAFSRRRPVELDGCGVGFLIGHSRPASSGDNALVTVLELQCGRGEIPEEALSALAPREREIALRVVDGLSGREIAEHLVLSRHTVREYVKRIYRKLDVNSRVALTRLLLGSPERNLDA